jgi:hypothetical protein
VLTDSSTSRISMAPVDIIFSLNLMLMELHRIVNKHENLAVICKYNTSYSEYWVIPWKSNTHIEPQSLGLGEIWAYIWVLYCFVISVKWFFNYRVLKIIHIRVKKARVPGFL